MYVVYRESDKRIVGIFHEWSNAEYCLSESRNDGKDVDVYEIQTDILDTFTVNDMISPE